MRQYLSFVLFALLLPLAHQAGAQNRLTARVVDDHENDPLIGVNVIVEGTNLGSATDGEGRVTITGIPDGDQTVVFSYVGFEPVRMRMTFPLDDPQAVMLVRMEEDHGDMEEISVTATRSSRTIADEPTRVEVIAGEEIDEKLSMEPSNISMLLNESPGIFIQQTSAVSGGASIRIQGLDGRYTQMLKDGFPLYGGFSGGLSILQVPPLDLQQVEVIKGPSSTLYGADAIAGLVNLVTKKPTDEPVLDVLTNVTTAGGYDLGGLYRGRGSRVGVTFLATGNVQQAYDPDGDAFSNMPRTRRGTIHPTLYYYPSERSTLSFGVSTTIEEREGGDMAAIEAGARPGAQYLERNWSRRITSQARLDHSLGSVAGRPALLTVKNSVSLFNRELAVPGYTFDGRQIATYSEASMLTDRGEHDLVVGLDLRSDAFLEDSDGPDALRDYTYSSVGVFVQDTWDASERVALETGVRLENHSEFGSFMLPKASLLVRLADGVSTRMGAGLGYKAPSVFLEPSEERAFQGVLPLGPDIEAERSEGGSVDVNINRLLFGRLGVSLNQAFYFTNIDNALVPAVDTDEGTLRYVSAREVVQTQAWETNVKFTLGHIKLFLGYVHLEARTGGGQEMVLTPTHKTYSVLVYEKHGKGRIGLEGYWTGPQRLIDGSQSEGYWITGVMGQLNVRDARLFLNFENILDTMQTDYSPVVLGPRGNPRFTEIWAPLDGFVINGGVKYTF
jgi:iron complex outermembrane receptor protein